MSELAALQRRFQELVMRGEGDLAGLLAGGNLGIYAHAYGARLHDALAGDHPKLRAALGSEAFGALVSRYIAAHPPTSFTLRDAGGALVGFLAADALAPPWAADLARLERARVEVFDGPDARALDRDTVGAAEPGLLPLLPLRWVPASLVVELAWSVDDAWRALEDGRALGMPVPVRRTVLVWRRGLMVVHRTLEPDEAVVAATIGRGVTFAEVCARLAPVVPDAVAARTIELLVRWLDAEALSVPEGQPR